MKTILFFGDSNTYGYNPRGYFADRYPKNVRWTDRLATALAPEWCIRADGMNGREIPSGAYTLPYVTALLTDEPEERRPDLFAVMLGTNDLFSTYPAFSAERVAEKMERFLDYLSENAPGINILLIAPPAIFHAEAESAEEKSLHQESIRLGELYREIAEKRGCRFINAAEWAIPLSYDGVHLSEEGHCVFAEKLAERLRCD